MDKHGCDAANLPQTENREVNRIFRGETGNVSARVYFHFPHALKPDLAQAGRHCHARDARGEAPMGPSAPNGGNAPGMGYSQGDALAAEDKDTVW